jgi:hypothetical protein
VLYIADYTTHAMCSLLAGANEELPLNSPLMRFVFVVILLVIPEALHADQASHVQ